MLVLKHILGGSLKITPENSNNLARQKIASKESLGWTQKVNLCPRFFGIVQNLRCPPPKVLRAFLTRFRCIFDSFLTHFGTSLFSHPKDPSVLKIVWRSNPYFFFYGCSCSLSVPFSCLFCLEKQAFLSPRKENRKTKKTRKTKKNKDWRVRAFPRKEHPKNLLFGLILTSNGYFKISG